MTISTNGVKAESLSRLTLKLITIELTCGKVSRTDLVRSHNTDSNNCIGLCKKCLLAYDTYNHFDLRLL